MGTTDNPMFKNLRGRWRSQYSDWPVLARLSTGLTTCYDVMQFLDRFRVETTTIFSMLDLENLPQKKLGLLAVNKKLIDSLDV